MIAVGVASVAFMLPSAGAGEIEPEIMLIEDCRPIDPEKVEVIDYGDGWRGVVELGNGCVARLHHFGPREAEARQIVRIVQHYGMNQMCRVGLSYDTFMTYGLVNGRAPRGSMPGEHSTAFNPNNIDVKEIGGRWKIVDGSLVVWDFGSRKDDALKGHAVIKKYRFNHRCNLGGYAGRKYSYFKRQMVRMPKN